jgi:cellulose synthase/poly-beta-1,6-N-acetylglucosamine synthase-like glycosyltransferase
VAFLDDDAAPRRDWARRISAPFEADPLVGCVGGACHAVFTDATRPDWLSDRLLQFAAITRFGPEAREATSSAEWPFGANMAFRREALAQAGPFSEALGREGAGASLLSGDDSALIEAVRRVGWKIWLEPSAVVDHAVHAERCRSRYYWRRLWWQGITRARAQESRVGAGLRLLVAAPVRLCLYAATRDRVYLYRIAETGGYLAERLRPRREPA